MPTAFNFYQPEDIAGMESAKKANADKIAALQRQREQVLEADRRGYGGKGSVSLLASRNSMPGMLGSTISAGGSATLGGDAGRVLNNQIASLRNTNTGDLDVAKAKNQAFGMTAGVSDQIMNDPRIEAALSQIQSGMANGPYTQGIQQQIVNRNADQTAAAEAVNADEVRNMAAARGLDPTQAIRQAQQQRQAGNIAFQGDMATKSALANYDAQQNAARTLASARLSQYGQAQPGYSQAANYAAQTQFASGRTPAVQGGAFNFSQPSVSSKSTGSVIPRVVNSPTAGQTMTAVNLNRSAPAAPKPKATAPAGVSGPTQGNSVYAAPLTSTQQQRTSLLNSLNAKGTYAVSNQPTWNPKTAYKQTFGEY